MTDIVERLHNSAALMYEAAYEIQHLKRALAELSASFRQKIAESHDKPLIDKEFLDRPVTQVNFGKVVTPRIHVMFSGHTMRDLVRMTEKELLRAPNIGRFSVARVQATLVEHGLYLGMDI